MYTPSEKNASQVFALTKVHKFHAFERISSVLFDSRTQWPRTLWAQMKKNIILTYQKADSVPPNSGPKIATGSRALASCVCNCLLPRLLERMRDCGCNIVMSKVLTPKIPVF
jgi:hypothetical protein